LSTGSELYFFNGKSVKLANNCLKFLFSHADVLHLKNFGGVGGGGGGGGVCILSEVFILEIRIQRKGQKNERERDVFSVVTVMGEPVQLILRFSATWKSFFIIESSGAAGTYPSLKQPIKSGENMVIT
jgi:hypothetical protein